jgi:hypothetical protein
MFLAGLCLAVTMSGGATTPDRRALNWLGASGLEPPPLNLDINMAQATAGLGTGMDVAVVAQAGSAGATATSDATSDVATAGAGATVARTRAAAPAKKGPVDVFLDDAEVNDGVQQLLAAIHATLPGYATVLEVVQDPDDAPDAAYLMVSVCMGGDDQMAWDAVETLIDNYWLPLAPRVRGALGVGRELVSVG